MNRGHLRAEDGIGFPHLLGKDHALMVGRFDFPFFFFMFPDTNGSQQRAYADPCTAQVVYFINFQTGIDFVRSREDIVHLIGCDGIQSTAEGIELDQVEVIPLSDIGGGSIEPGMVHPLVGNDEGALRMP